MITATHSDAPVWSAVDGPNAFTGDFYSVRILANRILSYDDIGSLSGCLGYALRAVLAGESLSEPTITFERGSATILEYGYDSTKSRRDDPDFDLAFATARDYILYGTPVRTTDRAGVGSKGTRLVEGLTTPCTIKFWVY